MVVLFGQSQSLYLLPRPLTHDFKAHSLSLQLSVHNFGLIPAPSLLQFSMLQLPFLLLIFAF